MQIVPPLAPRRRKKNPTRFVPRPSECGPPPLPSSVFISLALCGPSVCLIETWSKGYWKTINFAVARPLCSLAISLVAETSVNERWSALRDDNNTTGVTRFQLDCRLEGKPDRKTLGHKQGFECFYPAGERGGGGGVLRHQPWQQETRRCFICETEWCVGGIAVSVTCDVLTCVVIHHGLWYTLNVLPGIFSS